MNHCINSTPSRSLSDDLKESAWSRLHKTIAKIQASEYKKLHETAQVICDEGNTIIASKKCTPKEIKEIQYHAQEAFDLARKEYRGRIDKVVAEEKIRLDLILKNLSLWMSVNT